MAERKIKFETDPLNVTPDSDEPRVQKVVKSKAVTRKKRLSKKFAETFLGEDVPSVRSYILYDVLIPAAKTTLSDVVSQGIEMLLFGEARGGSRSKRNDNGYVSYTNYYDKKDRKPVRVNNRARHDFDDIILETRADAEDVLINLVDLTADFGSATVGDLYDLVGITHSYTDRKWGWYDLGTASVRRVRNGYILDLPKVQVIE